MNDANPVPFVLCNTHSTKGLFTSQSLKLSLLPTNWNLSVAKFWQGCICVSEKLVPR